MSRVFRYAGECNKGISILGEGRFAGQKAITIAKVKTAKVSLTIRSVEYEDGSSSYISST
jgi:hypothetical protein